MTSISQNPALRPRDAAESDEEEAPDELLLGRAEETGELAPKPKKSGKEEEEKKKKKNRERDPEKEAEMEKEREKEAKRLESFLFSSIYDPVPFGKEFEEEGDSEAAGEMPLFVEDRAAGNDEVIVYEEDLKLEAEDGDMEVKDGKAPAWVDEEEESAAINISKVNRLRKLRKVANEEVISGREFVSRLRAQHAKLNPGTEWACTGSRSRNRAGSDDDDSDDDDSGITMARGYEDVELSDIVRTNEELVLRSGARLLPGQLEYSRLLDANAVEPSNGPINSVQFHRNGQLLMTAGLDRCLRFFQIDGKRNTKIQSIFVEDCPIYKATFLPNGSEVVISGRRKFFYSFDLVKAKVDKAGPLTGREEKSLESFEVSPDSSTIAFIGNEGYILLVSSITKELIGTLKMNGTARCLAFANDGKVLLSSGGDGHIYHWDLRMRKCFHKAVDEGSLIGTALCTSFDGSLFAAGSSSGIVNIYNREDFLGGKRKPLKTIENLTTGVNRLKFNHDAQILALTSGMKKNSMKLVHIPSYTVFSNFPPSKSSLKYPRCVDFSSGGGFMAVGNAGGKVLLYKLHHYQHA